MTITNRGRRAALLGGFAVFAALALPVQAADYPSRPVMLVVAFPPGGPSDVLARIVGKKMEQLLGQPVVIENKPGAGGNIAAEYVARATPDGYTLLMGNNSILATNESLYKKLAYSPEKDFVPITLIGTQANILVVNPKVPVRSLNELIDLCKAQPGKINFASSGYGAAAHLAGELFKAEAQVDIVHVPYKGAAPALQDVIAGHDQMMFATAASVIGHIKSGTGARAGGDHAQAHGDSARSADHGRSRLERLRGQHLARPGRARGHAAGDYRQAARHRRRGAARHGRASVARPARRRYCRRHAGASSKPISPRKCRNGPKW